MHSDLISIIVPVYNLENYIQRCIDSVKAQTHTDFELILVDDGSKDQSGSICDRNQQEDRRIKVIHQKNAGVSVARNAGLEAAGGKYLMFVDGDDFIHPRICEILLGAAKQHHADIVMCDFQSVSKEKASFETIGDSIPAETMNRNRALLEITDMQKGTGVNAFAKLYTKEVAEGKTFLPGIPLAEDQEYVFSCMESSNIVCYVREPLYYYFFREGSAVNSSLSIEKEKKKYVAFEAICSKDYMNDPEVRNRIIVFRACQCELATINKMVEAGETDRELLGISQKYIRDHMKEIQASDFPRSRKIQLSLAGKNYGLYRKIYKMIK